jgi:hypothetical protein
MVITSILAFVLIVETAILTTTFVNVFAQADDGDIGGMTDDVLILYKRLPLIFNPGNT